MTRSDWTPTVLRVALGVVIFPHAAQKAFGWFGGGGLGPTLSFFSSVLHVPAPIALLVIAAELLGSIGLLLGLYTRLAAIAIGGVMLGAIALVHAPHGFFMNWFGNQAGEGYEYHLLVLGIAAALAVTGGGRASLDRRLLASTDR